MADLSVTVQENRVIVQPFGSELLTPLVSAASVSAAAAEVSAGRAEAVAGPAYADTAAGLAATSEGEWFAVDSGGGIITTYKHSAGPTATDPRAMATTTALAASTGAALVGSIQSGAGAVARTVQDKMRDLVSVKDFGALGDGTTDDTAAFNLAIAYANAKGGIDRTGITGTTITIPAGRYPVGYLNPVTVSNVHFVGSGKMGGTVLLHSYNGPTFRFEGTSAANTIVGGGLTDVRHEYLGTPGAAAAIVQCANANTLDFSRWHLFNIGKGVVAGTSGSAVAVGILANEWTGGVCNMDAPLIDLRYGAGFFMANSSVFVSGVATPPIQAGTFTNGSPIVTGIASTSGFFVGQAITGTARVSGGTTVLTVDSATQITMSTNATSSGSAYLSGAMTTTAGRALVRGTAGFWDTCQITASLFERFDQGFALVAGSGLVYQNFELCNTKMDYFRRHAIYADTASGGVISSITSDNLCWFATWDTAAVTFVAAAGLLDDCDIKGKVPIAGGEALYYNVAAARRNVFSLNVGGINRLQAAPAALYFVAGSTGFNCVECRGNDDMTASGLPFRADWGLTVGANCDDYLVTACRMTGSGGFFNWFASNTSGSTKRQVVANGNPDYAVQMSGGTYVIPASGVAFTNKHGFAVEVIVSGGTVTAIAKNGVTTGLTSGTFKVGPGETLTPTYSAAPTILFFGLN